MNRVLHKVLSGRWLLTLACSWVLVYCSMTEKLDAPTIAAILSSVFASYFSKLEKPPSKAEGKTDEAQKGDGANA